MSSHEKTALIAGASGLVGNELLQILLEEKTYNKVYAIVRSPLEVDNPKLTEVLCNFDHLEEVQEYFAADDVFCCLGTTIKKAKTKEAMYKIDVGYPLALAKLAKEKGAQHFLLISSMSANPNSPVWYSRMKGQLEEQLTNIPYQAISILRPSILLGDRKEFRLGENIAIKILGGLSSLFHTSIPSRIGIEAKTVARGMYQIAQLSKKGITLYSSEEIAAVAKENQ